MALAFLVSCAGAPKKPAYKKIPPAGKPPAERAEPAKPAPVPEAQRANVRPSTMDAVTPQRQASMKLVGKGKEFLKAGDADRAASVLMDAVNVDSSNGVAYYYLAVASAKQGKAEVAEGLLDKAEALLGADEEWGARIDDLRANLGAPGSDKIVTSPIDVSF
ncbi:MAG TPA: hypothetical protein PLY45_00270 [bacterium]|nr:hypothetical protein [bacterium]